MASVLTQPVPRLQPHPTVPPRVRLPEAPLGRPLEQPQAAQVPGDQQYTAEDPDSRSVHGGVSLPQGGLRPHLDFEEWLGRQESVPTMEQDKVVPWDQYSRASSPESAPASLAAPRSQETTPLSMWQLILRYAWSTEYANIPDQAPPSRPQLSLLGESDAQPQRHHALPPAPVAVDAMANAMHVCWGGPWEDPVTHAPPPAAATVHPQAPAWVTEFKPRWHAAPGLDLRPARMTSGEKSWAGTQLPPVEHAWVTDLEALSRAQMSCLSAADWLFAIYFGSAHLPPDQRDIIKGFAFRELKLATQLSASMVTGATMARRKAILDRIAKQMLPSSRDWLLLQPVSLQSSGGLFGQASSQVPDILRQHQLQTAQWSQTARRTATTGRQQQRQRQPRRSQPPAPATQSVANEPREPRAPRRRPQKQVSRGQGPKTTKRS